MFKSSDDVIDVAKAASRNADDLLAARGAMSQVDEAVLAARAGGDDLLRLAASKTDEAVDAAAAGLKQSDAAAAAGARQGGDVADDFVKTMDDVADAAGDTAAAGSKSAGDLAEGTASSTAKVDLDDANPSFLKKLGKGAKKVGKVAMDHPGYTIGILGVGALLTAAAITKDIKNKKRKKNVKDCISVCLPDDYDDKSKAPQPVHDFNYWKYKIYTPLDDIDNNDQSTLNNYYHNVSDMYTPYYPDGKTPYIDLNIDSPAPIDKKTGKTVKGIKGKPYVFCNPGAKSNDGDEIDGDTTTCKNFCNQRCRNIHPKVDYDDELVRTTRTVINKTADVAKKAIDAAVSGLCNLSPNLCVLFKIIFVIFVIGIVMYFGSKIYEIITNDSFLPTVKNPFSKAPSSDISLGETSSQGLQNLTSTGENITSLQPNPALLSIPMQTDMNSL